MNLCGSDYTLSRSNWIVRLLFLIAILHVCASCGPGKGSGRRRSRKKLTPLVYKQHVPNVSENTLGASGLPEGRITRNDTRFKDLVPNYNSDIIFKDKEGTGADRFMTERCKEKLNTLAISVMNLWPGVKLRVTEGWEEIRSHATDSLHYEGRAVDITTSDRDRSKYGMLARLAVEAGFDWVYYQSREYIHCSVKSESSQAAKSLGCFTGDTKVMTSSWESKLVSELEIGEKILTLNENGDLEMSEVLLFMHRSPDSISEFLRIQTESGLNLTITPSHLILRWQKPQISSLHECIPVYAKDVKIGEQLLIRRYDSRNNNNNNNNSLFLDRITNIERIISTGLYAPLTITGTIVVNDIVASCYAILYSQQLAHLAFAPFRFYNRIQNTFYHIFNINTSIQISNNNNNGNKTTITSIQSKNSNNNNRPIGIHWYCRMLQKIADVLVPDSWMLRI